MYEGKIILKKFEIDDKVTQAGKDKFLNDIQDWLSEIKEGNIFGVCIIQNAFDCVSSKDVQ